jgi:hypothetical protein
MGKGDESVIDKGGAEENSEESAQDQDTAKDDSNAEDQTGKETADGEAEQSGEADPDGGEGAGKDGEDAGETEGEVDGAEGDDKPLSYTRSQFDQAVAEAVQKQLAEAAPKDEPAPAKELTEEEWAKKEEDWGMPRTAIKQVGATAMKVYDAVSKMLDERLSKFERRDSIDALSREPGFADAKALQPGIDQYMKEMGVPSRMQSDPRILKAAAIYARGLSASKRVQKARTESEKHRKISGVARPASPGNGKGKAGGGTSLTPAQKIAAKLHPGGEAGYIRDLKARGTPIAA